MSSADASSNPDYPEDPSVVLHRYRSIGDPQYNVKNVAFSPDGNTLAFSVIPYGYLVFFDIRSGTVITELRFRGSLYSITAIAYSPDGEFVAIGTNGTVMLIETTTYTRVSITKTEGFSICSIDFSPDSKKFAFTFIRRGRFFAYEQDVTMIDIETNSISFTTPILGTTEPNVMFSSDGRYLVTGNSNEVIFFDVFSGDIINTISCPASVCQVVISPDGETLAILFEHSWYNGVYFATTGLYEKAKTLPKRGWEFEGRGRIRSVVFSPNGETVAFSVNNWDSQSFPHIPSVIQLGVEDKHVKSVFSQPDTIYQISFSPDGTMLSIGCEHSNVVVYDLLFDADEPLSISMFDGDNFNVPDWSEIHTIKTDPDLNIFGTFDDIPENDVYRIVPNFRNLVSQIAKENDITLDGTWKFLLPGNDVLVETFTLIELSNAWRSVGKDDRFVTIVFVEE